MFRNRAIFLIVISAILIPLIFIARDILSLAVFVGLFILCQVIMLYLFYKEPDLRLEQWYVFWIAVLSLGFMLLLVLIGRYDLTEMLGLALFLIYFIGLLVLLFKGKLYRRPKPKKEEKKKETFGQEDLESFRRKDELEELAEFFKPDVRQGVRVVDLGEPKIEKVVVEEIEEEEKPKKKKLREIEEEKKEQEKLEEEQEDWEELPRSIVFDYEEEKPVEELKIKEIKEAPKINFEKVKKDLEKIDSGVKTISEKIKLISEKAILEGAEKKLRELEAKKKPKPKKKELRVFASKTGTKFHYKKNCLGLRRVSPKNLVTYANSQEARKKKLKPCGMCK